MDPHLLDSSGDTALHLSIEQLDLLREHLSAGLVRAETHLRSRHTPDSGAELCACKCTVLSNFAESVVGLDGDLIAGALVGFERGLVGTALFAMDPSDAFDWIRAAESADVVGDFLARGSEVLGDLVAELGEKLSLDIAVGAPRLEEDSVAAVLLRTHAPSDTAVLSLRLHVAAGDAVLPAYVFLLVEPKSLQAALPD